MRLALRAASAFTSVAGLVAIAAAACTSSPDEGSAPGILPDIALVTATPEPTATLAPTPGPAPSAAPARDPLAQLLGSVSAGNHPAGVDVDPTYHRIYVANEEGRSLTVIDGSTGAVGAPLMTVPLGGKPRVVVVSPSTGLVFVTMYFQRSIKVFDSAPDQVTATIQLEGNPLGMAINEVTGRLYVFATADAGQGGAFTGIYVIDRNTHEIIARLPIGDGAPDASGPRLLAVNTASNRIYAHNTNPDRLLVIDGATNSIEAQVPLPALAFGIDADPETSFVFVAMGDLGNVLVIDDRQGSPTRHQVITEVKTGGVTRSVEVHENGRMVYVADTGEKSLIAIDRRSHEVVDTIALTSGTNTAGEHDGIAIDESSHRVYIAHQFPDIISVVQTVN